MESTTPTALGGLPGGGRVTRLLWNLGYVPLGVSVEKGAGGLSAEAGGREAAGPETGAAGVHLSAGKLCCWIEGEALEARIQCPRAAEDPEPAGKHHQAAGAGRLTAYGTVCLVLAPGHLLSV